MKTVSILLTVSMDNVQVVEGLSSDLGGREDCFSEGDAVYHHASRRAPRSLVTLLMTTGSWLLCNAPMMQCNDDIYRSMSRCACSSSSFFFTVR